MADPANLSTLRGDFASITGRLESLEEAVCGSVPKAESNVGLAGPQTGLAADIRNLHTRMTNSLSRLEAAIHSDVPQPHR
jgi:hypothetical protein